MECFTFEEVCGLPGQVLQKGPAMLLEAALRLEELGVVTGEPTEIPERDGEREGRERGTTVSGCLLYQLVHVLLNPTAHITSTHHKYTSQVYITSTHRGEHVL